MLFADTFKFCLSLYGHKLPVLALDISSDGTLLASGSADKNLKFWGLDFGDCHRSLFAHDDSVTQASLVWITSTLIHDEGLSHAAVCWGPRQHLPITRKCHVLLSAHNESITQAGTCWHALVILTDAIGAA